MGPVLSSDIVGLSRHHLARDPAHRRGVQPEVFADRLQGESVNGVRSCIATSPGYRDIAWRAMRLTVA